MHSLIRLEGRLLRHAQASEQHNSSVLKTNLRKSENLAKLFCQIFSERTSKHQIANKELEIKIYYGSREDSKLLAQLFVFATDSLPKFFIHTTVEPQRVTPLEPLILKTEGVQHGN